MYIFYLDFFVATLILDLLLERLVFLVFLVNLLRLYGLTRFFILITHFLLPL